MSYSKKNLIILLFVFAGSANLSASIFLVPPDIFYPEYGDFSLITQSYGWAELSKVTPELFDNDSLGYILSNGYRTSIFHNTVFNLLIGLNLSMLNKIDPAHPDSFSPRKLLTEGETRLYVNTTDYLSLSLGYHHDCSHDIDLEIQRVSVHDWIGLGIHIKPFEVQPQDAQYRNIFRLETGMDFFLQTDFPAVPQESQKVKFYGIVQNEIKMPKLLAFFWEARMEAFVLDTKNTYHVAKNSFYLDRSIKIGMSIGSTDEATFSIFSKLEYINDTFLVIDYEPARYLSFGVTFDS